LGPSYDEEILDIPSPGEIQVPSIVEEESESFSQIYEEATKELDSSEPIVTNDLEISNKILGSGSFARVYLGTLRRNKREIKVAVKVFLNAATEKMIRNECIIMKYVVMVTRVTIKVFVPWECGGVYGVLRRYFGGK
jgi:predicted unusual protein kinase regulating ubiquinone biosynthesis (AarF/ABC1/UbiB family)